jgi:hypothetical protein
MPTQEMARVVPTIPPRDEAATSEGRPGTRPQEGRASADDALREERIRSLGVFGTSLTLHLMFLLILACIVLPGASVDKILTIFADNVVEPPPREGKGEGLGEGFEDGIPEIEVPDVPIGDIVARNVIDEGPPLALDFNDNAPSVPLSIASDTGVPVAINFGSEFGGRSSGARGALVRAGGGTPQSEAAVEKGLEWLQRHQQSDGSWSFDHRINNTCAQECSQEGTLHDCPTGATAMALLAFLGAGHTPDQGKYKDEVKKGLLYLRRSMQIDENGGDLRGEASNRMHSGMYVQGLATIALCEAYAMSVPQATPPAAEQNTGKNRGEIIEAERDESDEPTEVKIEKRRSKQARKTARKPARRKSTRVSKAIGLEEAAQQAIDFIMNAQDPNGGGWRYVPLMKGDTSVVGWQVMALQSARAGSLSTRPEVFERVQYFLDSVSAEEGSQYGYMSPQIGQHSTTAIGLLCRMYVGWNRDNPGLRRGVEILSEVGPDFGDMYYNYYATQVMHHWGGEAWQKWNATMRDHLVYTQVKDGHAAGSWNVADAHGTQGGRLYMTCLCIMTLEVYYRHLPLYQRETLEKVLMGKKTPQ